MAQLTVARALTARLTRRVLNIATVAAILLLLVIFLVSWALAHFVSVWWWLLLMPFMSLFVVFLIVRLVVLLIVRLIHRERMTTEQKAAIDAFVDKLQALAEVRATPPWLIVAICVKDVLLYHEARTAKKLINGTAGLRRDYKALEALF